LECFWVFYGFVGVDWGVLSLSLDLGDIKSCFEEIRWLENLGWNLSLILYIQYQNKKILNIACYQADICFEAILWISFCKTSLANLQSII